MTLNAQHKSICITLSISIVLLCFLANIAIVKQKFLDDAFFKVETLVEITPETKEELQEEALKSKAETNKAFNENSKHIAQAYQVIPPAEEFDYDDFKSETENNQAIEFINETANTSVKKTALIDTKKRQVFNKANQILEQQKANALKGGNKNSTVSYSLVKREANRLPIPVYLCDGSGKVIVNITVNKQGKVKSTSINIGLSSANGCLQNFALKYAKKASFNLGEKDAQLGTITYHFQ